MAGANLGTVAQILKEYYLPPVTEQLNNSVLLFNRLESRNQELVGSKAVVPVHYGRSGGIGAAFEDGNLPTAGNQAYLRAEYDLKYPSYGRIRVTGPSMAKTKSQAGAFLETLKSEVDGMRSDLRRDAARQAWGDGTGVIATCAVSTTTTTILLGTGGAEALRKGHLYVGQVIDIGTAAAPTLKASGVSITAVNVAAPSITISGSNITTAVTDQVTRAGVRDATLGVAEMAGMQSILPTAAAAFGNIDPTQAGKEFWQPIVQNVAGNLTQDGMVQILNQIDLAGGDSASVALYTTYGMQRIYFNLLQTQVRYTEPQTLKGGFKALDFSGHPLIADRDAPWGRIYFVDESQHKVFSPDDNWHYLDEDGDILKWVVGKDAWEAVLTRYMNLGTKRRNTSAVMFALTQDTTGY